MPRVLYQYGTMQPKSCQFHTLKRPAAHSLLSNAAPALTLVDSTNFSSPHNSYYTMNDLVTLVSSPPILALAMCGGFFLRPIYEMYVKQKRSLHAPSIHRMQTFFHGDNKIYTKEEAGRIELKERFSLRHPYYPSWLRENEKRVVFPNIICLTAEQGSGKSVWADSVLQSVFKRGDTTLFRFSKYMFRQDVILQFAFEVCRELDPRICNWTLGRFREHFVGATEEDRRKKVLTYYMDTLFIERTVRKRYLNSIRKKTRDRICSIFHDGKMFRSIPLVLVDDIEVLEDRYYQVKEYDSSLAEVLKGMIQSLVQTRIVSTTDDKTYNTVFIFNNEGTIRWIEEITRDENINLVGGLVDYKFPPPSEEWLDELIQRIAPRHSPKTREFIIKAAGTNIGAVMSAASNDPYRWVDQRKQKMKVLIKRLLEEHHDDVPHAATLSMLYLLANFKYFTMKQVEMDLKHPHTSVHFLERRIVKRQYVKRENTGEVLETRFIATTAALQTAIEELYKTNSLRLVLRVIQEREMDKAHRLREIAIKELTVRKLLHTVAALHKVSALQVALFNDRLGYIHKDSDVMELDSNDIILYTIDREMMPLRPSFYSDEIKFLPANIKEFQRNRDFNRNTDLLSGKQV